MGDRRFFIVHHRLHSFGVEFSRYKAVLSHLDRRPRSFVWLFNPDPDDYWWSGDCLHVSDGLAEPGRLILTIENRQ